MHHNCQFHLPFLAPRDELVVSPQAGLEGIKDVIDNVRKLIEMTKTVVGSKCVPIVAPVLPITIINADLLKHDNLHRLFKTVPQVFVSNNAAIKLLFPLYDALRESSTNLAKELLINNNIYPMPLLDFKPRIKGAFRTLGTKQTHFPFLPNEWEQMMRNLIYTALHGFPAYIPDAREDNFILDPLQPELLEKYKKQASGLRFSRIVFIADKIFDDVLADFKAPLVQVINLSFSSPEEDIVATLEKIKSLPSKTLCIYVTNFSVVMEEISLSTACQLSHCLSSIDCFVLKNSTKETGLNNYKLVEDAVKTTRAQLTRISNVVNGSSFFIVAPLCPMRGLVVNSFPSDLHIKLHADTHKPHFLEFLGGEQTDWLEARDALDKLWVFLMESFKPNIGVPYKAIVKYQVWKESSLSIAIQTPEKPEEFASLKIWKSAIVAFIDLCAKMRKGNVFYFSLECNFWLMTIHYSIS